MDALEAILTRRSIPTMSDEVPQRAAIEALLDAAVMAPTHHMTQPWRFIVLAGDARVALGGVMADSLRAQSGDDPRIEERAAAEAARPLRAPVIVTVVYVPSDHPKAIVNEDRYAVGAAMQNVLLAAHAAGFGTFLRTGPAATDPAVAAHLGLSGGSPGETPGGPPPEEIAGFIYLGRASQDPPPPKPRTDARAITEWRGWP